MFWFKLCLIRLVCPRFNIFATSFYCPIVSCSALTDFFDQEPIQPERTVERTQAESVSHATDEGPFEYMMFLDGSVVK